MKRSRIVLVGALCVAMCSAVAGVVISQERTASGSMDTQMTWTALSTLVKAASDKAEAVDARMDQVVVCGKKGMIYAPGVNGADSQGCVSPAYLNNIVDCGRQNKIFSATTNSCVIPGELSSMISCGNQNKIYSASTNSCVDAGGMRWYVNRAGPSAGGNRNSNYSDITRALNNSGLRECGSNEASAGRKCTQSGAECAVVTTSERTCGSQGDYTCSVYSSDVYRCE